MAEDYREDEFLDELRRLCAEPEEPVPVEPVPAKPEPKKAKKNSKGMNKWLYYGLITIFAAVFIGCAVYIVDYITGSIQQGSAYEDLLQRVEDAKNNGGLDPDFTIPAGMGGSLSDGNNEGTADTSKILPQYRELYAMNNDLVGWITVPGTKIDYPVVQSPKNRDYYLYRNFQGKHSSWGCIYAREECDVFTPSDNVVLYGHHMKDGSMFAQLDKYKRKSYWEENQYLYFNTLYEEYTYQIIAAFKTSANVGEGFAYHTFNYADSEDEFDAFMKQVRKLQMYKTGVTAEYGDVLLTLSTCEYTLENGRFVVIAKRLTQEEAEALKQSQAAESAN